MSNGPTTNVYQIEKHTIEDEIGNEVKLQGRSIVDGIGNLKGR